MPWGYDGVYVIHGPPGCGKTTRLAKTVARICAIAPVNEGGSPVVVCSLTNAAAAEAAGRVDLPDGAVSTLHSVGYRSLGCPRVVDQKSVESFNTRNRAYAISPVLLRPAWDDAGPDLLVGPDDDGMPGDKAYRHYHLLRHGMIPSGKWPPWVRTFADRWDAWKSDEDLVDFTDMIERGGPSGLAPGVILVDEAQDLSRLEGAYLERLRQAHAAALILVGDSDQALYAWRGADPQTLHDPTVPVAHVDVLAQSFRVPAAVHRLALRVVRMLSRRRPIDYHPRRINPLRPDSPVVEGKVCRCSAIWTDPEQAVQAAGELAADGKTVLLLATTNRMTRPACAVLRRATLPFSNPWRRRDRQWNPLRSWGARVRALLAGSDQGRERPWTYAELAEWVEPLRVDGLLRAGAKRAIADWGEEAGFAQPSQLETWFLPDPLADLALRFDTGPDAVLRWWSFHMTASARKGADYALRVVDRYGLGVLDEEPRIHPSTVHACKGGEADHVFLFPDLSRAAMDAYLDGGEGRDAVIRTFYVGITRARECLHICEPAGRRFFEL